MAIVPPASSWAARALEAMAVGQLLADATAIFGSIDVALGEVDR